ncbi:DUF3226 domain-containing protein [Sorangium sp. So ce131]|uniref:DUF3226 domain-containing protein n=1 Tax=Sorangium sp. So ce131 TaxID=3133282 RepID=UPI003F60563E
MSRHANQPFPSAPFGLLLVEGGDERAVCEAVAGRSIWTGLTCWHGSGRNDLPALAALAASDPNFRFARSVGLVLDAEDNVAEAHTIASKAFAALGESGPPKHGQLSGSARPVGAFFAPDGVSPGCIETLCRQAVSNTSLSACVDALVVCAGSPHALQARADKGWLRAYLGMCADPGLRFHQALSQASGIDPAHAAFDPLRRFLQAL